SVIQCRRCQSPGEPSSDEYWHMGATAMRLEKSRSPRRIGWNRAAVMGTPMVATERQAPPRRFRKAAGLYRSARLTERAGQLPAVVALAAGAGGGDRTRMAKAEGF